jgi:2-polyprenyl-6-methoxyphenol hydroxylase-like FAD-dependent oxidoreductase
VKTSEVPVLIVGGGAAGTTLSLELARRGVEARCIDRLPGPAATSRAIVVHARTAELLERVDERLIARYLERGIVNLGYVLHFVDGAGKRSEVRPGIDFTHIDSRYPYMLVHGQSDTENNIRDYLSKAPAQFGCRTACGVESQAPGSLRLLWHDGHVQALLLFCQEVERRWRKWLNRRSWAARLSWAQLARLRKRYPLPPARGFTVFIVT